MKKYLLVLALAPWLGGCCSMAPMYERPAAPVPSRWTGVDDAQATTTGTVHELYWREFFTDPALRRIIENSLTNNLDLRLAMLNVEKARALYGVQRAELYPPVDATGIAAHQQRARDLIGPQDDRRSDQYNVNLGMAAWEIDLFGRIRSLKNQALQEYLASEQVGRGARISLIAQTATAYFTLASERANLDLACRTLEAQQQSYDIIHKQYTAALISELDLRRAQTQVDAARLDVARFTTRLAQSRHALDLLAGQSVPEEWLPVDLSAIQSLASLDPGLSSEVLLWRPDVMAAEHQLKGAHALIGAARSAFFPRIGLTAAFGTASDELTGLFGGGNGTWTFTPVISMPVFDARVWAAARVSEAMQKIALANYQNTIQKAFREVADALATRATISGEVAAQQSFVDAAAVIDRLAMRRYEAGLDGYLSVLDAHRTLLRARQALIALQLVLRVNEVQTYTVLGGGGTSP